MKTYIGLCLSVILFSSCVTREEINATIWLNNFSADEYKELCLREPSLVNFGFYRKLNDGKIEFISACKKEARDIFSIPKDDFNRILDKALPKPSQSN